MLGPELYTLMNSSHNSEGGGILLVCLSAKGGCTLHRHKVFLLAPQYKNLRFSPKLQKLAFRKREDVIKGGHKRLFLKYVLPLRCLPLLTVL